LSTDESLTKLFQLIGFSGCVPDGFKYSYIVPILKIKDTCSYSLLTCENFREIAISPIISKVFECCVIDLCNVFLKSADNQFSFKKGVSCGHAIYSTRLIVDSFIKGGNTANLCSLDLSKAFDNVNHHGLYLNLMKRRITVELLIIFENWFSNGNAYIKC